MADQRHHRRPDQRPCRTAAGTRERRGRYDTLGRTVYVADTAKTALAEVLQHLRVEVMSITKDATAIGMNTEDYRRELTTELHDRGLPGPREVPVDWQLTSSLFKVHLPATGWWVLIDAPPSLNALSERLGSSAAQLTLGDVCGDNRALTITPGSAEP